jgi:acetyltransferase-like isoleucine patch superfamily enzyme
MNPITLLRRGEGPVWGTLKRLALAILRLHVPVGPLSRPFFRMLHGLHVGVREGGLWLLRFFWFEPLFRSQCTAVGQGLVIESLPYIVGDGKIVLGEDVRFSGKPSFGFLNRWDDAPELIIGDHTFVGHGCSIAVGASVRIGKHCLLAGGVSIADYDGHPIDAVLRRTSPPPPAAIKPVVIGDDVWIGADAKILKGVTIGDRSVVGAGAVVTKSVPPDVIVAGNPARVVKSLVRSEMERSRACPYQSSAPGG